MRTIPRRKPDQVITLRLELNDYERHLIDQATAVYTLEKGAESINDLLSFDNLYIGITIFEIMTGEEVLYGTPNDLNDIVDAVKTYYDRRRDQYPNEPPAGSLAMIVKDFLVRFFGINTEPVPWMQGEGL